MAQAHKQVYGKYIEKLVVALPMNDVLFITKLSAKGLLPGDNRGQIDSLDTPAQKSSYLLYNLIKPSLNIGDVTSFDALLDVMEDCEYQYIQKLAAEIKAEIGGNVTGMYIHKL